MILTKQIIQQKIKILVDAQVKWHDNDKENGYKAEFFYSVFNKNSLPITCLMPYIRNATKHYVFTVAISFLSVRDLFLNTKFCNTKCNQIMQDQKSKDFNSGLLSILIWIIQSNNGMGLSQEW